MSCSYQIVPGLAAAVHGVTEELPFISDNSIERYNHERFPSSTSDSSNDYPTSLSSSNSRTKSNANMKKLFDDFDKNGDGELTVKEFQRVMHDLGYKAIDKDSLKQMFGEANKNRNTRTLNYDEFAEFLESKLSVNNNNTLNLRDDSNVTSLSDGSFDIHVLFNCYDLDGNGVIEPKELRKVMKRVTGKKLSKQDINDMMNVADTNGDGVLDKKEFECLFKTL